MKRAFSQRIARLLRDIAGTNLIEAAIIVPLRLLLTFSVVDFASSSTATWRSKTASVANAARTDSGGDYPVRIHTIGMGFLVRLQLGTRPETSESILRRIANDSVSPDHNSAQLDGAYFYAPTAADVSAAYQGIQNQILRLSR